MPGCPIQIFTDQQLFALPRNFSQLITSFFASESLGIPRTPFSSFLLFTVAGVYDFDLFANMSMIVLLCYLKYADSLQLVILLESNQLTNLYIVLV